jgi:hypothetical protein
VFGEAFCGWVKDRTVDALGAILLVDESLVAIHNHNEVVVVRDRQAVDCLELLAVEIHGVFPAKGFDCIVHPLAIPSFVRHFFL